MTYLKWLFLGISATFILVAFVSMANYAFGDAVLFKHDFITWIIVSVLWCINATFLFLIRRD